MGILKTVKWVTFAREGNIGWLSVEVAASLFVVGAKSLKHLRVQSAKRVFGNCDRSQKVRAEQGATDPVAEDSSTWRTLKLACALMVLVVILIAGFIVCVRAYHLHNDLVRKQTQQPPAGVNGSRRLEECVFCSEE